MGWPRPACAPSPLPHAAVAALLAELRLTPKPALVDRRGSGAHQDLDFALMQRSAHSLLPCFQAISTAARRIGRVDQELREALGEIGRQGEARMLVVTGGINTHRGAIWNLGLLLAAAELERSGMVAAPCDHSPPLAALCGRRAGLAPLKLAREQQRGKPRSTLQDLRAVAALTTLAARIARIPDRFAPATRSHGVIACQRYHAGGARAQAMHGFPHVQVALRELHNKRAQGVCTTHARLDALLRIMTTLDDTCLLHRAGRPGLEAAHTGALAVLDAGGSSTLAGRRELRHLEQRLMHLNASPGGAADVLVAALFVEQLLHR